MLAAAADPGGQDGGWMNPTTTRVLVMCPSTPAFSPLEPCSILSRPPLPTPRPPALLQVPDSLDQHIATRIVVQSSRWSIPLGPSPLRCELRTLQQSCPFRPPSGLAK